MTAMNGAHEDATWLLEQARRADWAFPTTRSATILTRPGEDAWLPELDALRPRLGAAIEAADEASVEIAARTWRLWMRVGESAEAHRLVEIALASSPGRADGWALELLYGDALLAHRAGNRDRERARARAALAMARTLGDAESSTLAHLAMCRVAFGDRDAHEALAHARSSYAASQSLPAGFHQAPLHMLAQCHRLAGDFDAAAELLTRSVQLNREIRDPGMITAELFNLCLVQIRRGQADEAEVSLDAAVPAGPDDPYVGVMVGIARAGITAVRGDRARASARIDHVLALIEADDVELAVDDRAELDWLVGHVRG